MASVPSKQRAWKRTGTFSFLGVWLANSRNQKARVVSCPDAARRPRDYDSAEIASQQSMNAGPKAVESDCPTPFSPLRNELFPPNRLPLIQIAKLSLPRFSTGKRTDDAAHPDSPRCKDTLSNACSHTLLPRKSNRPLWTPTKRWLAPQNGRRRRHRTVSLPKPPTTIAAFSFCPSIFVFYFVLLFRWRSAGTVSVHRPAATWWSSKSVSTKVAESPMSNSKPLDVEVP